MDAILEHASTLRLSVFVGLFALFSFAEALWPRRGRAWSRQRRWPSNLGIVIVDTLVGRVLVPLAPVALALQMEASGGGLLGLTGLTRPATILVAIVLLDLAIYAQHVLFHAVPVLWRLHRMHHADTDFDTSTALRFHPLEIVLSLLIKLTLVWTLGPPAEAVVLFEMILNGMAMFNHANLALPGPLDRALRLLVVTPDVHRVHHSARLDEMHTNFGFNLSIWDRIFRTWKAQPVEGHMDMTIGLPDFRDPEELRLDRMLTQPFRQDPGASDPAPASSRRAA